MQYAFSYRNLKEKTEVRSSSENVIVWTSGFVRYTGRPVISRKKLENKIGGHKSGTQKQRI